MRDEYNMRRRLVVKSFNDMGLTCFEPRGAFYAFPCIKSTGMSSQDFCTKLLEQKHVAIIPGDAFGAVSYTHLDVYKRQARAAAACCSSASALAFCAAAVLSASAVACSSAGRWQLFA